MKKLVKLFKRTSTQIILISLITILAYFNILGNGFSFDDRDFFLDWHTVRNSESGLSAFLSINDLLAGELPSHHRGVYRPIRSIFYLLGIQVFGSNPVFYHALAILVHLLITILIYFITRILVTNNNRSLELPFITAAFFASHPIHTEAVTYTAASFDTIGILFFFASFYFYLKAEGSKTQQGITQFLSLIFAFFAFFTYEMTLTLPLLILAYEIIFKKLNFKNFTQKASVYLPYLTIIVIYCIIRFALLKIGNRADYLGDTYLPASNQAKLGTIEIIFHYLYLLIWPQNLTVTYSVPSTFSPFFFRTVQAIDPTGRLLDNIAYYIFLFPISIVTLIIAASMKLFKKHQLLTFGITWFFISLLPVLNIIPQGSVMAERFLYIPSFGFCLILALLVNSLIRINNLKISNNSRIIAGILLVALITILYSARTITRNQDWKDLESIFLSAIRVQPTEIIPNAALGSIYLEQGQYTKAIPLLEATLKSDPEILQSQYNLGLAYEKLEDYEKAITSYKKTLQIEPAYYYANVSLGSIYQKQNKYDDAISEFQKAIASNPDNIEAHFNLAGAYTHKKDYAQALKAYEIAQKLNPQSSAIYINLGYISEETKDFEKAILYYKKAIELEPKNYYSHLNLANLYDKQGALEAALKEFKIALSIKPEDNTLKEKIRSIEINK